MSQNPYKEASSGVTLTEEEYSALCRQADILAFLYATLEAAGSFELGFVASSGLSTLLKEACEDISEALH